MRFCIAKRKIYTNGPKISFRGKFFYSRIGHSGHGVFEISNSRSLVIQRDLMPEAGREEEEEEEEGKEGGD